MPKKLENPFKFQFSLGIFPKLCLILVEIDFLKISVLKVIFSYPSCLVSDSNLAKLKTRTADSANP